MSSLLTYTAKQLELLHGVGFSDIDIPLKQAKYRRKGLRAFPYNFYPSKILLKNQEMCKES